VPSKWAINPSGKNDDLYLTVWTKKTRLVRYLLYCWVQRDGEDFNQAEWPLMIYAHQILNGRTYFYSPLDGMLVHRRVTPSIKFAGTHLYTWVKRGTVRVKCLVHEHNAMSPARSRTRTARSGVKCANHEATVPPQRQECFMENTQIHNKLHPGLKWYIYVLTSEDIDSCHIFK